MLNFEVCCVSLSTVNYEKVKQMSLIKKSILLLVLLLISCNQSAYPHNDSLTIAPSEGIKIAVDKLQIKLLLTKDQSLSIQKIVSEALTKPVSNAEREKSLALINEKIVLVLTKKQSSKFVILKNSWLNEIFDDTEDKNLKTD